MGPCCRGGWVRSWSEGKESMCVENITAGFMDGPSNSIKTWGSPKGRRSRSKGPSFRNRRARPVRACFARREPWPRTTRGGWDHGRNPKGSEGGSSARSPAIGGAMDFLLDPDICSAHMRRAAILRAPVRPRIPGLQLDDWLIRQVSTKLPLPPEVSVQLSFFRRMLRYWTTLLGSCCWKAIVPRSIRRGIVTPGGWV